MKLPLSELEARHTAAMSEEHGAPPAVPLTADEMNTLMAEATLGVQPADSKLAPLTPGQREYRERIGREVAQAGDGVMIEVPPEFPDANLVD